MINQGIVPSGFCVTCQNGSSPINCTVDGVSVTQRTVSLSYDDDLEGRDVTISVSYSCELCKSSSIEAALTGITSKCSGP